MMSGETERTPSTLLVPWHGDEAPTEALVLRLLTDAFPYWGKEESDAWRDSAPANVPWVLAARIPGIDRIVFIWPEEIEDLPEEAWWVSTDITETERDAFDECLYGLVVETTLVGDDPRVLWQTQIKVAHALAGDAPFIYDDNSMRILSRAAMESIVDLPSLPDVRDIYGLHAIFDEREESRLWLHTHGLARMGVMDLEAVGVPSPFRATASKLISLLAERQIDGQLAASQSTRIARDMSVVLVPMERGLHALAPGSLGSEPDRDERHFQDRAIIMRKPERQAGFSFFGRPHATPNLDGLLTEIERQELLFFTENETRRMRELASYRWPLFLNVWKQREQREWTFLVRGVFQSSSSPGQEHLWVEVSEISDSAVGGILINDPLRMTSYHVGQMLWIDLDTISDWSIATEEGLYDPATAPQLAARIGIPTHTPKPVH